MRLNLGKNLVEAIVIKVIIKSMLVWKFLNVFRFVLVKKSQIRPLRRQRSSEPGDKLELNTISK